MKILSILTQSKEEKDKKVANRIARGLKRGQEALIDKLEAKKDEKQAVVDSLMEISIDKVDVNTWNQEYQNAKVDLELIEAQIKIANETTKELFTDEA